MENNLVQSNNELITMNNELSTVNVEEMFTNTLGKETKRAYVQAIKEFFGKDLCDISIEDMQAVTPEMANKYAMGLLSKGLKRNSINRKLIGRTNTVQKIQPVLIQELLCSQWTVHSSRSAGRLNHIRRETFVFYFEFFIHAKCTDLSQSKTKISFTVIPFVKKNRTC